MSDPAVAIAIVTDSSLALFTQWNAVLQHYINPLIQRLLAGKDGSKFNIGLVTYGTSDLNPSPILAKRYFVHPTHIYKELREEAQKFGLGRTNSGGKMGMAVLEGYASTIEMFDLFSKSLQDEIGDKPITEAEARFHIIHVLSSPPDESRHPLWNQCSELDTLSWKTMADELKKRDINLNIIFLRQSNVLSDLHSEMVSDPCQPWFNVHPGHNILLSSTSSWSPSPAAAKRPPEEVPSEASEEAKKPRVSSPVKTQPSPKLPQPPAQPPVSTSTAGPSTSETVVKQPTPAPALGVPNTSNASTIMQIVGKAKTVEVEMKKVFEELKAAVENQQPIEEINRLKAEVTSKKVTYEKLKQLAMQLGATHMIAKGPGAAGPSAGGPPGPKPGESSGSGGQSNLASPAVNRDASQITPAGPPAGMASNQPTQTPPQPAAAAGAPAMSAQERQAIAQMMQNRFSQPVEKPPILAQNSGGAMPNLPPGIPPQMALQYQKLMEQRGVGNGQQPLSPAAPGPQTTFPNPLVQQQSRSTWSGRIEWSGSDQVTRARKEVSAEVIAHGQGGMDIRSDLWPPSLTLSPSKDQAVPTNDLRNWLAQYKPHVCIITAKIDVPNSHINDSNFKSLVSLLNEKKVYAIASWNLPGRGGVKGEALLLFPGQKGELAGACFPENGIPAYPKPSMAMNPQMPGNMGGGMVPNPMIPQALNPANFNPQQLMAMNLRLQQLKAQNGGTLPLGLMNLLNKNNNNNNNNAMGGNTNNMGGGAWNMDPGMMNQLGGPSNGMSFGGGGSNVQPLQPGFQMQGGMQPNLNPNANLMQQMQQQLQQQQQQQQGQFQSGAGNPGNFNMDMFQHLMKR